MRNAIGSVVAFVAAASMLVSVLSLVGCATKSRPDPFAGIGSPVYKGTGPLPKGGGRYYVGDPYQVAGLWFYPQAEPAYDKAGIASWYGPQFNRRMTSNGEWFDMDYVSAAHPTMPLPSYAQVTNLENGRTIVVRVNDRGPFVGDRIIDLSMRSAEILGYKQKGTAKVRVQYIGPAPLNDQGSHLAAMNDELLRGTPRNQLIAAADRDQTIPEVAAISPAPVLDANPESLAPANSAVAGNVLFIQVGAFSNVRNAERTRDNLASLGEVHVTPVSATSGGLLYNVTLLPLSDRMAGETLNQVQAAGHPDARLVFNQ